MYTGNYAPPPVDTTTWSATPTPTVVIGTVDVGDSQLAPTGVDGVGLAFGLPIALVLVTLGLWLVGRSRRGRVQQHKDS